MHRNWDYYYAIIQIQAYLFDWKGVMGVRDVIAHHYFEVDPDAVFDIIKNDLNPLKEAINFFKEQLYQDNK